MPRINVKAATHAQVRRKQATAGVDRIGRDNPDLSQIDMRMSIADIAPRTGTPDDGAIVDGASETFAAM
ncbi:hypothetical protein [Paraburkholderia sp. GAS42]|jgi:hypothetical protein|uniref:hypothetical protein n=1 Tax=Paraburkholderia sp. GAS42 TaxID=3035135 RepID=UPI003D1E6420